MCWFGNIVRQRTVDIEPIHHVEFEHGDHSIFVIDHRGLPIALVSPGVGAPAAGTSLEVVIALGATQIIGCGGAGVVKPGFDMGHVIVPTGAVGDEGTSYHRTPHDAEVTPHPWALAAIDDVLTEAGVPHDRGLVWTTDAIFRETAGQGRPSTRAGMPGGRDGGSCDVRVRRLPRRHLRTTAVRRRRRQRR